MCFILHNKVSLFLQDEEQSDCFKPTMKILKNQNKWCKHVTYIESFYSMIWTSNSNNHVKVKISTLEFLRSFLSLKITLSTF